jgi:hypothetical protein
MAHGSEPAVIVEIGRAAPRGIGRKNLVAIALAIACLAVLALLIHGVQSVHGPPDGSEHSVDTVLALMREVLAHDAFAALEGPCLKDEGKVAEAWVWYRAILGSSWMVRAPAIQ